MIYLSGAALPILAGSSIGYMLTPNMGNRANLGRAWWAADTGLFSQAGVRAFSLDRYLSWLDARSRYRSTNLFVTAPDVVGNWDATLAIALPVLPILRERGWLAALVAQDGLTLDTVPWSAFDVLFIGGTDHFKEAETTYDTIIEAGKRGLWVHAGRVNSFRRLKAMAHAGANSADGTYLKYGPDQNLPRLLKWLAFLDTQTQLEVA